MFVMSVNKTGYLITIGEPNIKGVFADEFEEALIFVGRLIEKLSTDDNYRNKYIYVTEYVLSEKGEYMKQDNLFTGKYLIEK